MNVDLNDEESAALLAELDHIIDGDRYPFSPRIRGLRPGSPISHGAKNSIRNRDIRSRRRRLDPGTTHGEHQKNQPIALETTQTESACAPVKVISDPPA